MLNHLQELLPTFSKPPSYDDLFSQLASLFTASWKVPPSLIVDCLLARPCNLDEAPAGSKLSYNYFIQHVRIPRRKLDNNEPTTRTHIHTGEKPNKGETMRWEDREKGEAEGEAEKGMQEMYDYI